MQQTLIVVVETLNSSLTLRCYQFTELKIQMKRSINIDYFIESVLTRSFSKVLQLVNKNPYKALSML